MKKKIKAWCIVWDNEWVGRDKHKILRDLFNQNDRGTENEMLAVFPSREEAARYTEWLANGDAAIRACVIEYTIPTPKDGAKPRKVL